MPLASYQLLPYSIAQGKVRRPESALIIRTEMRKIKSQIARVLEPYSRLEKWLMNPLINSAYFSLFKLQLHQQYTIPLHFCCFIQYMRVYFSGWGIYLQ